MSYNIYLAPLILIEGALGSMYGELTSISSMGSDQDSNRWPIDHTAQTLTTTPSCYLTDWKILVDLVIHKE